MIPSHLDFKYLKQNVSIETVLSHKGLIKQFKHQGDRLVGTCPIHNGDNPNAFVVSLSKNVWNCFTRCHTGGDVVDFVRHLDKLSHSQTAKYLSSLIDTPLSQTCFLKTNLNKKAFQPFTIQLNLDPFTNWLKNKGVHPKTAIRFEAGAYYGHGFLSNCIGLRLHDLNGSPIGYAGRRLNNEEIKKFGKWKFPPKFPKSKILYNSHRLPNDLSNGIVIVECPWGVMRLSQLNIPSVALLGLSLSPSLYGLFRKIPRVILMLDGDDAGRKATANQMKSLHAITKVLYTQLPQNLDPDDLNDHDLSYLLKDFFS